MLIQEKLEQAVAVLNEVGVDCWLTYVRETIEMMDPALHFVAGRDVVWDAVFLIHKSGRKVAIVGAGDHLDFVESGFYDEVLTYTQSITHVLRQVLADLDPETVAINYSLDNTAADGLSLGMYKRLLGHLAGTPYKEGLVSADSIIAKVRGRKTPEELRRIKAAALETLDMLGILTQCIQPGWTLRRISNFMHQLMRERNVSHAWSYEGDPGITSGDMEEGHGTPGEQPIAPGHVLRLDFGIKKDGYCSDLQRSWYILRPGETEAPVAAQDAFRVVRAGIAEAAAMLKPGVLGWEVDAAVRTLLQNHGYPEYPHALGHQVGIWAHDGGSILGPRWERYGQSPYQPVEVNQVYTLEFSIRTPHGFVSQEDMVVITEDGCQFLAPPQQALWLLRLSD